MSVRAFVSGYQSLSNKLKSPVTLKYRDLETQVDALWDTGATGTCISKEVVTALSLIPLGKQQIHTPVGLSTVNTYQIDILLPNKVLVSDVIVRDSEIGDQGLGVLIGMDIINLGDFAVSSFNKQTVFTFRIPSQKKTDYVAELRLKNAIGPIHGKGRRKGSKKKK